MLNRSRFVYSVLHTLLSLFAPFRHARLDQIIVAYANSTTKAILLVIMLNRSRFVYSVLHTLLSQFAFSLGHLTTSYAI